MYRDRINWAVKVSSIGILWLVWAILTPIIVVPLTFMNWLTENNDDEED